MILIAMRHASLRVSRLAAVSWDAVARSQRWHQFCSGTDGKAAPTECSKMRLISQPGTVSKSSNVIADDLSDREIAVLCDLLDGPGANLKGHKRPFLISS